MAKQRKTADHLSDMIVSAMGLGRCISTFARTMLTGGSRQLFPLLAIRLVFKGALMKSLTDCAFSLICGNDVTPKREQIYFVWAPGAPTIYRLRLDRAIAHPSWASNYFRGAEKPSDTRFCGRSIKRHQIHGQSEAGRQARDGALYLHNHAPDVAAMDLFVVPTIGFKLLYAFVIVWLDRRDLVWINVTTNPTAEGIAHAS